MNCQQTAVCDVIVNNGVDKWGCSVHLHRCSHASGATQMNTQQSNKAKNWKHGQRGRGPCGGSRDASTQSSQMRCQLATSTRFSGPMLRMVQKEQGTASPTPAPTSPPTDKAASSARVSNANYEDTEETVRDAQSCAPSRFEAPIFQ